MKWILPEGSVAHDENMVGIKIADKCFMHFKLKDKKICSSFGAEYHTETNRVGNTLVVKCTCQQSFMVPACLCVMEHPVPDEIDTIQFVTEYIPMPAYKHTTTKKVVDGIAVTETHYDFGGGSSCLMTLLDDSDAD